jgi:hypothetical protein
LGSIGAATGTDGAGGIGSLGPANQDVGDAQAGTSKFGPTVQPPSANIALAAKTTRSIVPHFGPTPL